MTDTTLSPEFTAYRPIYPDQDIYFEIDKTVLDANEEHPVLGPGIRINNSNRNESGENEGENDLIRVDLKIQPNQTVELIRNTENLKVYLDREAKYEIQFTNNTSELILGLINENDAPKVKELWVEYKGEADFYPELAVIEQGGETIADKLVFHPFENMVVLITGENQEPRLIDNGTPNHLTQNDAFFGLEKLAVSLLNNGYDVHLIEEPDGPSWTDILNVFGGQSDQPEIDEDIHPTDVEISDAYFYNSVSEFTLIGYSHGGGSVYDLSERIQLLTNDGLNLVLSGYIDAIQNPRLRDENPSAQIEETRLPVGSEFHLNFFQPADSPTELLHGEAIDGARNRVFPDEVHGSIHNNPQILKEIYSSILGRMPIENKYQANSRSITNDWFGNTQENNNSEEQNQSENNNQNSVEENEPEQSDPKDFPIINLGSLGDNSSFHTFGDINQSGEVDQYLVELTEGQKLEIALFQSSGSDLDPVLSVVFPNNVTTLVNNDVNGDLPHSYLEFTAPESGTYTINASGLVGSTGDYLFRIQSDDTALPTDSSSSQEGNNEGVIANSPSNLAATEFKSSHSKASYKEELELTFTVQNLGGKTSEGGRVQVILADEDEALEDGKVINDYNIPTLTSGDEHTYNKSIDLPTTGKGDYKIGVLVVPDVKEIITSDNAKYSALEIGPGLSGQPDLRSYINTSIRESVFYVGEEVTIDYQVYAGPDGSTSFNYGLYLSSDEYWSSDDILLHESYSRGLGSGGTNYASATFEMPALSNGKDGVAYLISVADINDSVNEESEANNTRVREFALSNDGPDNNTLTNLTAGSLFLSDSVLYAGESFTYRPIVAISSPDDAFPVLDHYSIFFGGAYKISLIMSEDRFFDSGDVVVHTSINSGVNRVDSTGNTIPLPEWVETGSYYVAAAVDLINEIEEDNELDNLTNWQKIDVVNNLQQKVYAVDDLLAIKPGEKIIIDLLANDYSETSETINLKYVGTEQFNSNYFTGLPLDNGLRINKLNDGSLEVDASQVANDEVFSINVPYQISGGQSYYDDLADLNIFVGVSVPESVVNDTPKDTENDPTNSSDANTALSVSTIQSGGGFDPTIPGYVGAVVVEGDPDDPLIFAVNLNDATPEEGAKLVLEFTDDSAAFGQDTSSNISLDFGDGNGFVATTVSPQQSNGMTTFTIDVPSQVEKLTVAVPTINDGLLEAAESLLFNAYIEGTEKLSGVTGTIIDSNRANLNYVESVAVGVGAFDPNLLGGSIGTSVTEGAEANPLLFLVNLHEFTSSDGQYVTLSFVDETAQFGVDTANSVSLDLGDGNGFVNSTAAFTTANGVSSAQVYVAEGIGSFMVALQVIDDAIQEDAEQISFTAKTTNNDTFNEAVNTVKAYILDNGDTEVSTDKPQDNQANTNLPIFLAIENGIQVNVTPEVYTGTVDFLEYQFLGNLNGNVVNGADTNDFINLLAGDDAADGKGGRDVLDGGIGSNFLTGGEGDDTFFIDGRGGTTTWSTITDFTTGDMVNIWGWIDGVSQLIQTEPSDGAQGFEGVTFHYDLDNNGQIDTSITFSGLTSAQAPTSSAQIVGDNGYLLFA